MRKETAKIIARRDSRVNPLSVRPSVPVILGVQRDGTLPAGAIIVELDSELIRISRGTSSRLNGVELEKLVDLALPEAHRLLDVEGVAACCPEHNAIQNEGEKPLQLRGVDGLAKLRGGCVFARHLDLVRRDGQSTPALTGLNTIELMRALAQPSIAKRAANCDWLKLEIG